MPMSLAINFLKDYFKRAGAPTQAEFAKVCGMTPTNVTDLMKGKVTISGRNVAKLIRGFLLESDRLKFLHGYLQDQVPSDLSGDISISLIPRDPKTRSLFDKNDQALEVRLLEVYRALPSEELKENVITYLRHLKGDEPLRKFFMLTVGYLQESDGK